MAKVKEAAPTVSAARAFAFELEQQRGTVLRAAEALLEEAQDLVARLKQGKIPTTALNVSSVGRLLTDHARLVTLEHALEVATEIEKARPNS